MSRLRIMIIDGDATVSELLASALADEGHEVCRWEGSIDDATFVHDDVPDLVVLDTWVRQRDDGVALLGQVWNDPGLAAIPVLVCMSDLDVAQRYTLLFETHRCMVVPKPFALDHVLAAVEEVAAVLE